MENQSNSVSQDDIELATPTKVLNVQIPEPVYWHVRFCASESRMSVKAFMAEFCKTAKPIGNPVVTDQNAESGSVLHTGADVSPGSTPLM